MNRILELVSKEPEAPVLVAPIVKVVPQVVKAIKAKTSARKDVTKEKK
ncbi:MAG: hypothetical protein Q7R94_00585 [bacterium]|nr:hypothetical protein [bacterium]